MPWPLQCWRWAPCTARLRWRKRLPALQFGDIAFLETPEPVLAFTRSHGEDKLLCVFNLSDNAARMPLPPGDWTVLSGHGLSSNLEGGVVELPGWGGFIARRT